MNVEKRPEDARSGQKLRRDPYLVPGLVLAVIVAFVVVALVVL